MDKKTCKIFTIHSSIQAICKTCYFTITCVTALDPIPCTNSTVSSLWRTPPNSSSIHRHLDPFHSTPTSISTTVVLAVLSSTVTSAIILNSSKECCMLFRRIPGVALTSGSSAKFHVKVTALLSRTPILLPRDVTLPVEYWGIAKWLSWNMHGTTTHVYVHTAKQAHQGGLS